MLYTKIAMAINVQGYVKSHLNGTALDACKVSLIQNQKEVFETRTDFNGHFEIKVKKDILYQLKVVKPGYKIYTQDLKYTSNSSFSNINISLEVLNAQPVFEEMASSVDKKPLNQDIMEDIGNLEDMPEGTRIIEAVPLKFNEIKHTGFNVQTNRDAEIQRYVDVETFKENYNKETLIQKMYSDKERLPSSYYIESNIYYGSGKALLTGKVRDMLSNLAVKLKNEPNTSLKLVAYADCERETKVGDMIAKIRAEEITKHLMSEGVRFEQLIINIIGNQKLENGCYEGVECDEFQHQDNRRVDMFLVN